MLFLKENNIACVERREKRDLSCRDDIPLDEREKRQLEKEEKSYQQISFVIFLFSCLFSFLSSKEWERAFCHLRFQSLMLAHR